MPPGIEVRGARSELAAVVGTLAMRPAPLAYDGAGGRCLLCGGSVPLRVLAGRPNEYAPDHRGAHDRVACPWRRARELAGLDLNRIPVDERDRMGEPFGAAYAFAEAGR
jgi:hypothetical protein